VLALAAPILDLTPLGTVGSALGGDWSGHRLFGLRLFGWCFVVKSRVAVTVAVFRGIVE